ncbi:hypothetical protein LCGC14_0744360 [marine sediment metagenome]|uniref:Uncharacterized protein n=1 Tax=marine sediment metagenome TaxID=412755 RepID=A0A0F9SQU6_9ZZZZ
MEEEKGANPVEEVEGEEGEEGEESTAAQAPTAEAPQAAPEMKVVIQMKGDRALVGVQGDGTDPVVETLEAASLEELLAAVPGVVARARERWATSPRNPKYVGPPPPPPATPTPGKPARRSPTTPAAPTPRMF